MHQIQGFPNPRKNSYNLIVLSCTFNQSKYIEECLDGVLMQNTNFPFVHIVVDDCSSDGEQETIKSWMGKKCDISAAQYYDNEMCSIITAKSEENKNYTIVAFFLKKNLYGHPQKEELYKPWMDVCTYGAVCEGDDYWTDSNKLQKQVDFLLNHPDFSMCCHGAVVVNETTRKVDCDCQTMTTREYFPDDAFPAWKIPTASIVFNIRMVEKYQLHEPSDFYAFDVVLILICMHVGRVWGFEDKMSVYRMNPDGVTSRTIFQGELLRLCRHYQSLIANFPLINADYCHRFISMVYYSKFRRDKTIIERIKAFAVAIKHCPKYVFHKVTKIRIPERNDLFYKNYKC